ncbi:MAG: glucose-6-phosphate dehydrogenase [Bacteroidales bacterium]|nr:glucose-6-phosphate dehydrogenase [Bacteroidales bacterium]
MKSNVMVIFGGSGDLAKRKLIPALYMLHKRSLLENDFKIIATGRSILTSDQFRERAEESLSKYINKSDFESGWVESFLPRLSYFVSDPENINDVMSLGENIKGLAGNDYRALFYLATPPSLYEIIPGNLKDAGLVSSSTRIIVEKPFGYDLASAKRMNDILRSVFTEKQIFRIDHFLGKETVQNILALRFANGIFEPLWNRNFIERVEITAVENMGIETRGGFYDNTGALRDMVQNHLIQLLALVAMEPPIAFNEKEFRNEVVKVYRSLKPLSEEEIERDVIRGQYIESHLKGGRRVLPYREEKNVNSQSMTETFLAMKVNILNWRWEGVPFYIRTGKQMPTKVTEIVIHFKPTPHRLFSSRDECPEQNQLIIRLQPNEGAVLKFDVKLPGSGFQVKQVPMEFTYDKLGGVQSGDAYSRLIEDCLNGESVLFTRSDAVEASWNYFDPILKHWRENPVTPLYGYPAGTWGPDISDRIIDGGKKWSNPCKNLTDTDKYCEL